MNTIAVALSIMPDGEIEIPKGLEISWKPKDLEQSKIRARNHAEKSTYVYVAESLFEYLTEISKNPFWFYPDINFSGEDKKAIKVYNFLIQIPQISEELAIISELLCHWRNKIIHASTSNANLSSKKRDLIILKRDPIYESFHHFDTRVALENFDKKQITLKDVSTMTTIVIRCCRAVDEYFFNGIKQIKDYADYKSILLSNSNFLAITKQTPSDKKNRQIEKWLQLNYPYLEPEKQIKLTELFIDKA